MSNWLVGATDKPALKALLKEGMPCFDMSTNLPEGEWPWGSPSFKALGPHKIELIYKVCRTPARHGASCSHPPPHPAAALCHRAETAQHLHLADAPNLWLSSDPAATTNNQIPGQGQSRERQRA